MSRACHPVIPASKDIPTNRTGNEIEVQRLNTGVTIYPSCFMDIQFVRTIVVIFVILSQLTTESTSAAMVVLNDSSCNATAGPQQSYEQDGVEAREIAQYIPYYPFKGIDRFYDIGGFLYVPHIFEKIVNVFVNRYQDMNIDIIAGYVV